MRGSQFRYRNFDALPGSFLTKVYCDEWVVNALGLTEHSRNLLSAGILFRGDFHMRLCRSVWKFDEEITQPRPMLFPALPKGEEIVMMEKRAFWVHVDPYGQHGSCSRRQCLE